MDGLVRKATTIQNWEYPQTEEKPDNDRLMHLASIKQVTRVQWNVDSPRFRMACLKLGIEPS